MTIKPGHVALRRIPPESAREIYRRYFTGPDSQQDLAAEFGVSTSIIHQVVRAKSYKEVTAELRHLEKPRLRKIKR